MYAKSEGKVRTLNI